MGKNDMYYHIEEDVEKYPDLLWLFTIGGRATGKTYSALKWCVTNDIKFVFVKRLARDVDLMCGANRPNKKVILDAENSPMKPINRDLGTNIRACKVSDGIGSFYEVGEDGYCTREVGYIVSLAEVAQLRGFDMSDADVIIYDEFIPSLGERGVKAMGDAFLNLIRTVIRDKPEKGIMTPIWCLANANSLDNPVMETMGLVTTTAMMSKNGDEYYYDEERHILIHLLDDNPEWLARSRASVFYQSVKDTEWASMAYENDFVYDDVSDIETHINTREWRAKWRVRYRKKEWTCWTKNNRYVISNTKYNGKLQTYILERDADVNAWYKSADYSDLFYAWIDEKCTFCDYVAKNRLIFTKQYFDRIR